MSTLLVINCAIIETHPGPRTWGECQEVETPEFYTQGSWRKANPFLGHLDGVTKVIEEWPSMHPETNKWINPNVHTHKEDPYNAPILSSGQDPP